MTTETPAEKARRLGVPLKTRPIPLAVIPGDPNPVIAVCGDCGKELRRIMGYRCPQPKCPADIRDFVC